MNALADIEFDLKKIKKLGRQREDENFDFRAFLKQQAPERVDKIVHRLNRSHQGYSR